MKSSMIIRMSLVVAAVAVLSACEKKTDTTPVDAVPTAAPVAPADGSMGTAPGTDATGGSTTTTTLGGSGATDSTTGRDVASGPAANGTTATGARPENTQAAPVSTESARQACLQEKSTLAGKALDACIQKRMKTDKAG